MYPDRHAARGAGRARARAYFVISAAVLSLGGCNTMNPFDPAPKIPVIEGFVAEVDATKMEGATLFASLKAAPPACSETANAAAFDTAQAHVTTLETKANAPHNTLAMRSATSLKESFAAFRDAAKSAGARCLTARNVDNYAKTFDSTLDKLRTTETNKQGG
jgi:hypothetical protein